YRALATGRAARVASPLFIPSVGVARYFSQRGYALLACPLLYPGQQIRAAVAADGANGLPVRVNLYLQVYGENDAVTLVRGPEVEMAPGGRELFEWRVPDCGGLPIASVGIEARSESHANGTL